MLTTKQKRDYIRSAGSHCPHCKSQSITASHFESDVSSAWQPVRCDDCGKEWNDVYKLVGIEDADDYATKPSPKKPSRKRKGAKSAHTTLRGLQ